MLDKSQALQEEFTGTEKKLTHCLKLMFSNVIAMMLKQ